jgi:hypothetical protein
MAWSKSGRPRKDLAESSLSIGMRAIATKIPNREGQIPQARPEDCSAFS